LTEVPSEHEKSLGGDTEGMRETPRRKRGGGDRRRRVNPVVLSQKKKGLGTGEKGLKNCGSCCQGVVEKKWTWGKQDCSDFYQKKNFFAIKHGWVFRREKKKMVCG